MRQERWEKGWTTRKRGKRNERKGDDAAFERETGGDGGEREMEGSQGEWWERSEWKKGDCRESGSSMEEEMWMRRSGAVGDLKREGRKEWMEQRRRSEKDYKCKASEGERVWRSENHVGCGQKKKKSKAEKREVSEWEKENLIVFLAMEQR